MSIVNGHNKTEEKDLQDIWDLMARQKLPDMHNVQFYRLSCERLDAHQSKEELELWLGGVIDRTGWEPAWSVLREKIERLRQLDMVDIEKMVWFAGNYAYDDMLSSLDIQTAWHIAMGEWINKTFVWVKRPVELCNSLARTLTPERVQGLSKEQIAKLLQIQDREARSMVIKVLGKGYTQVKKQ